MSPDESVAKPIRHSLDCLLTGFQSLIRNLGQMFEDSDHLLFRVPTCPEPLSHALKQCQLGFVPGCLYLWAGQVYIFERPFQGSTIVDVQRRGKLHATAPRRFEGEPLLLHRKDGLG